ncbi:MAG: M61 family metallopeptidase [Terriglobia bacterium]
MGIIISENPYGECLVASLRPTDQAIDLAGPRFAHTQTLNRRLRSLPKRVSRFPHPGAIAAFLFILLLTAPASFFGASSPLVLEYHLLLLDPASHMVKVVIHAGNVREPSLDFVMPAWAPGRYAIYDFAKNVQQFKATGASGRSLVWTNTDKQTWHVQTLDAAGSVTVTYRVFANDLTGSFSQFDATHADINGACIYMYVAGHKRDPVTLTVQLPDMSGTHWKTFSGFSLSPKQTTFHAPNYDRLIDTPLEIAPEDQVTEFRDYGKLFRVVVHAYGEGEESPERWTAALAAGLKNVVHVEMAMMPAPDFHAYTFLFDITPFISEGDGMEHLNSTEIIVRGTLGADTLAEALELGAHEFFHVWNVKRLRPEGLGPFDYTKEDYTRSLWFAEGITQYYSYIFLLRSGIWSREEFLNRLADEVWTLRQDPGRKMMSAESSSFHAWFYDRVPQMQETNFANSTISYYDKGAILGMLLDLALRERTAGAKSLDDVMRLMYQKFYLEAPRASYYLPGRGYTEHDILEALDEVSGSDFSLFFKRYIAGTEPLPYEKILSAAGLQLKIGVSPGSPPSLGVLTEPAATGLRIAAVRPGGPAARAGLSRDDILVSVDQLSLVDDSLRDRLRMYPPGATVPFTVERYGRRETIFAKLGPPVPNEYTIQQEPQESLEEEQIREGWLGTQNTASRVASASEQPPF